MPRAQLDEELAVRIDAGEKLVTREINTPAEIEPLRNDYDVWNDFNRALLRQRFTTNEISDEYARFYGGAFSMDPTPAQRLGYVRDDIKDHINRLISIRTRLSLFEELAPPTPAAPSAASDVPPVLATAQSGIFVVHGRSDARKVEVARFLESLGLRAVILHEQPSQGRTLIEKFEDHASEAGFAVVLLTGDDEGGLAASSERMPRARQNVVFELGFFYGKLGRKRVCVLYEGGIEHPSDVDGIVYVSLDREWKLALGRELRAAGIAFDPGKLLG